MNYFDQINEKLQPKLKGKELTLESTFKDLGIDSLDLVDLVFELEEELGVTFEDDELAGLKTCKDVVALIEQLTSLGEVTNDNYLSIKEKCGRDIYKKGFFLLFKY